MTNLWVWTVKTTKIVKFGNKNCIDVEYLLEMNGLILTFYVFFLHLKWFHIVPQYLFTLHSPIRLQCNVCRYYGTT